MVIETARQVTGSPIQVIERDRRPGDPPILVGSSEKARQILKWQPQHADLRSILSHAWQWHQKRHAQQPDQITSASEEMSSPSIETLARQ
ncbi:MULTISPECIES: hypothetical protein [Leptolyngbya]|uniref:hypothetical protein n=1 Tax=Leptolyngbya TaxID=47251 RepID=UPI00321F788B